VPEYRADGVIRASWMSTSGVPTVRVNGIGTFSPEQALAFADAIRSCALDARASTLVDAEFDLFSDAALARSSDPQTSKDAAKAMRIRSASQKAALLREYADPAIFNAGLTDEEAGRLSGLDRQGAGYWKRCSELRKAGYIVKTGDVRQGSTGMAQDVCVITQAGLAALSQATKDKA
jgi:hypothetical protein